MGHHYVPRMYLTGFCQGTRDMLWAYDRKERCVFQSNIRNLAQQGGFYSDELEKHFSRDIEGAAAHVLMKIRGRSTITANDKRVLSRYLISQWKRVPRGKQRVRNRISDISEKVRVEVRNQIDELLVDNPKLTEVAALRKIEVDGIVARYRERPPDEIWYRAIGPEFVSRATEAVTSMYWRFFCVESTSQFLTSDNPVFIFEGKGVGNQDSELSFPITHNILLWASWRSDLPEGYLDVRPALVKEFNRRTVSYSTRFVYARRNEAWVLPFCLKDRWQLNAIG